MKTPSCGGRKSNVYVDPIPTFGNVTNHIHIEELEDCDNQELANTINQVFLEPLEEYRLEQPLTKFPTTID